MTPLPHEVDARTREGALTLDDIRRAIPRELFTPNPIQSAWALVRAAVCIALCVVLLACVRLEPGWPLLWEVPALAAIWIVHGWVLVGVFLIGHDCGHGSFASTRWVNTVVGWICMAPLANSFYTWRVTHDRHHAFTQLRGHDVDWAAHLVTRDEFESADTPPSWITRVGYSLPCGIFLWIAWNTVRRGAMLHTMFASGRLSREWGRLLRSNILMGLSLAGLYGALWYVSGFWGMFKYHGIPATIAMITSWIIITIQHANEDSLWYEREAWTPLRGQLVSTFDVRFPAWLESLWCYGNIHIPHHVAPTIPWYHLKQASLAIRGRYAAYYQERAFSIGYLAWLWRTPFVRKVDDKGFYVLARDSHVST
jgi:acyl-lipid omega-6 desaturase (Delta-12 desaturase)